MSIQEIRDEEEYYSCIASLECYVVTFGAAWCKNCSNFNPKLANASIEYGIPIFKVDVEEMQELGAMYDVKSLPCSIFLHRTTLDTNPIVWDAYVGSDIEKMREKLTNFVQRDNRSVQSSIVSTEEDILLPIPDISCVVDNNRFPRIIVHQTNVDDFPFLHFHVFASLLKNLVPSYLEHLSMCPDGDNIVLNALSCDYIPLVSPHATYDNTNDQDGRYNTPSLFEYKVPLMNAEGTCSNAAVLSKFPFSLLSNVYHLTPPPSLSGEAKRYDDVHTRLVHLNNIVRLLYNYTRADWIGIYRMMDVNGELALVKEAYFGEPSRAVFPVNPNFAEKSTNSFVGLNGVVRYIPNTRQRSNDVSYYECSSRVQSELCLPVLRRHHRTDTDGDSNLEYEVVGIIDMESWNLDYFSPQLICDILRVCLDIGDWNAFTTNTNK